MLAKICSDFNKPDGQFVLSPDPTELASFIASLSIRKVPGIGRVRALHNIPAGRRIPCETLCTLLSALLHSAMHWCASAACLAELLQPASRANHDLATACA